MGFEIIVNSSKCCVYLYTMMYYVHMYRHVPHELPELTGPCNIKRRDMSLTIVDFEKE